MPSPVSDLNATTDPCGIRSPELPQSSPTASYMGSPALKAHNDSENSISVTPQEGPLKRPEETLASTELDEKPLQKPSKTDGDVAFADSAPVFAIDVSGSTLGLVLSEEKKAVASICRCLSRDSMERTKIVPWSSTVSPTISAYELDELGAAGGTNPSKLTSSNEASKLLQQCSAWILLTDGAIDTREVTEFSRGICNEGLHGTACVVILFGYTTPRPLDCNISVGLAVFSNAADCLFLFHNIETGSAYILQSKGIFSSLLPVGRHELLLDSATQWHHLPTFDYSQLRVICIPRESKLKPNDLRLQDKRVVNLDDLFQDRVDRSTVSKIFENDDNLKSVLLAAQVRGRDDKILEWVSGQESPKTLGLFKPRPDVGSCAKATMRTLLDTMQKGDSPRVIRELQRSLRFAHATNWATFISSLEIERKGRNDVISNARTRIALNRTEMNGSAPSPAILSPVSPSLQESEQHPGEKCLLPQ